ncbi:hypothetical protein [uncultured Nonlabens sp.]|jgi:hypothetical protein|uniref:hypothetical protein n=1 Tax=uncultured Nonlabens sp. TaxID=859306 RepID=UPI0030DC3BAF|tara:strand:+ start:12093 stop:12296 length:204 start_codon:yes stop_codon:yes gene_type:complete
MLFAPITDPTTPILQDLVESQGLVEPRGQEVIMTKLLPAMAALRINIPLKKIPTDLFGKDLQIKVLN